MTTASYEHIALSTSAVLSPVTFRLNQVFHLPAHPAHDLATAWAHYQSPLTGRAGSLPVNSIVKKNSLTLTLAYCKFVSSRAQTMVVKMKWFVLSITWNDCTVIWKNKNFFPRRWPFPSGMLVNTDHRCWSESDLQATRCIPGIVKGACFGAFTS